MLLRDNGLTITLVFLFVIAIAAMGLTGLKAHNTTFVEHGARPLGLIAYLGRGDFASAVFENWESEFLQMAAYVILTAFLFQRGSADKGHLPVRRSLEEGGTKHSCTSSADRSLTWSN